MKNDSKLQKYVKRDQKHEEQLRKKYPNLKSYKDLDNISAYVVFETVKSKTQCWKYYNTLTSAIYQPESHKL